MGISKSEFFDARQNSIADKLRSLGHPARIAIVEHLLMVDSCICGDIVEELPLAQATVSQHLKELKSAGIIKGSVEGNAICYCINAEGIGEIAEYLSSVVDKMREKGVGCC